MRIRYSLWLTLFTLVFLLPLLTVSVSAHPGKTDANGGHTNRSTGEYHYHHGYSAHSHYDMDGDGDIDCPYDFDDQTGVHSGSNSNSSMDNSDDYSRGDTVTSNPSKITSQIIREGDKKVPSWVYWIFVAQAVVIIYLLISNGIKKDTIQTMESRQSYEIAAVKKACEEKIAEKNASDAELEKIRDKIADAQEKQKALLLEQGSMQVNIHHLNEDILALRRVRCWAKAAPLDVSFSKNGKPVYWKPNMNKPYGDYTVFISQKSNIYHTDHFCSGYHSRKAHIFDVIGRCRPCRKCAEGFFDFTTAPDWYTGKESSVKEGLTNNKEVIL